jgi:hypothetical protein
MKIACFKECRVAYKVITSLLALIVQLIGNVRILLLALGFTDTRSIVDLRFICTYI